MLSTKNIRMKAGKLGPKFIGPFKIIKCVGDSAYQLELPTLYDKLHPTFHVSLLEEYVAKEGQEPDNYPSGELPELSEDEDQEWEVEAIVDHKGNKNLKYLIKWKDWPDDHNTWLPEYPNLQNSSEILESYKRNHNLIDQPPQLPRSSKGRSKRRGRPRKIRV
jgi:hypothetical protein